MKLLFTILLVLALVSVTQGVIMSWEESLEGKIDYRFFFLHVPGSDGSGFDKPTFTLVNGIESYEYGALGSLDCSQTGFSVAAYSNWNHDGKFVWRCISANILPWVKLPGIIEPPPCSTQSPSGIPAIWNATTRGWQCGTYNQILTLATREDIGVSCSTADFLMMYDSVNEIRCVNPQDIDPSLTLQSRDAPVEFEERVDVRSDKKWYNIMSDMDATNSVTKSWNNWKWTPFMNYDSTSGSSAIPTPPVALPFDSTLLAVTFASFKLSSYIYVILPPTTTDHFTGVVTKLSSTLGQTTVSNTLNFDSISATSGQVTFSFSGNTLANAVAGEAFVAGFTNRGWVTLPISSDRHLVAITLWIQFTESFTEFFPLA